MVRDINLIENDIEQLQQQVQEISNRLGTAYDNYTEILGNTLQQQLVFSVYQICTQEYPQGFLSLSLSQQQDLQQKIRELGKTATENLKGDLLQMMNLASESDEEDEEDEEEISSPNIFSEQWETFSEGKTLEETASDQEMFPREELTPDNLMVWSNLQEEAIAMILATVSSQVNSLLQQKGVLSQELPKEMIDAALQTEGAGSISNRAPGVLHLMLEVERKNQDQQSRNDNNNEVMQLAVVRLRVGELEFAAPSLNTKRRELRTLQQQLQKLQEQYQRLTNERAIAQAELAWHSSWHED